MCLYERSYIANNLNAALFLSVHNNAMDDRGYAGTMTLCHNQSWGSGFNGYKFAQVVQKNLLSKLGTIDRGVRERPNLVVLKATAMPSALAEVAFMTNESDRVNLQNEAFRMKAAEALCNAVIESLKQVY
jgi:N-acetylmuramoyl-L-alanine amidase